jgi:hypothetical protein
MPFVTLVVSIATATSYFIAGGGGVKGEYV